MFFHKNNIVGGRNENICEDYRNEDTRFSASGGTLFFSDMSNRVEHQKRNQKAIEKVAVWFRMWCATQPSADTGTV